MISSSDRDPIPVVYLLWSGGWDSTFRLLDLLWGHRCRVQPFYVIDRGRGSLGLEIKTLHRVRKACLDRPIPLKGECAPPIFIEQRHIPPDPKIAMAIERLKAQHHLGDQYEWLARLATQLGVTDLEIGIHDQDNAHWFLKENFEKCDESSAASYAIRADVDPDVRTIFGDLRFPLLDLSKSDMRRIAAEHGFLDILELSFFCHTPLRGGWPCGTCGPCNDAFNEEMSYRVGWRGTLRHFTIGLARRLAPDWAKRPLRFLHSAAR